MKFEWAEIKAEIVRYRNGGSGDALLQLSEEYFALADRTVLAAELFTEESVQDAKNALLYMNLAFIFLAGLSALSAFYHEKRRKRLEEAEEENRRKERAPVAAVPGTPRPHERNIGTDVRIRHRYL